MLDRTFSHCWLHCVMYSILGCFRDWIRLILFKLAQLKIFRVKDVALKEQLKTVALLQLRTFLQSSSQWCLASAEPDPSGPSAAVMAWFLCVCVFLAVGLALLLLQLKLRMSSHGPQAPPCLPSLPIIGSLLSLRSSHPPHVLFKELQEKYGQTYSLMMGSHNVIIINQHAHAKEVLLKKGKTFAGRPRTVGTPLLPCLHHLSKSSLSMCTIPSL